MNLFSYINKKKNTNKGKDEYKIDNLHIDSYPLINQSKRDLLREMYCYIPTLYFEDVYDRYKNENDNVVHIQTIFLEKNNLYTRGLIDININNASILSEKDFKDICDKNRIFGSQKYIEIDLGNNDTSKEYKNNMIIYFYSDGDIFMNKEVATYISFLKLDDLGDLLASKCIELNDYYENNKKDIILSLKNKKY